MTPIPATWNEVGLTAQYKEFDILRGFKWSRKIKLYENEAKTKPLNLEGVSLKLIIRSYLTLTTGGGIKMLPLTSDVIVTLTAAQTTAAPDEQMLFYTELEDSTSDVCPLRGEMSFITP